MIGSDMPQSPGAIRASVLVSLAALGTLSVGILILVGGSARFSGSGFMTARQIAPWWGWGITMSITGTLALLGAVGHWMWLARIGHSLSSIVYLFLVTTLVDAALKSSQNALTGVGVYTAFALMHAFAAASADLEKQTHDGNLISAAAVESWRRAGGGGQDTPSPFPPTPPRVTAPAPDRPALPPVTTAIPEAARRPFGNGWASDARRAAREREAREREVTAEEPGEDEPT